MNPLGFTVVLALLVGVWAQLNVLHPDCDSPEAEEAALVAQDHLNAQHSHGYKYALSRIEDVKIYNDSAGDITYVMEIDLLETDCHVLDPTPLANCTVRPKRLTAVEGDCDVVLKKVGKAFSVTAFKCKTEESTEDMCLGCPALLPLNDTAALDFVHASLKTVNNASLNEIFTLLEVGRMSSQVVSGGPLYSAEYIIVEAQCSNDTCAASRDVAAARGFCSARGLAADHTVDCRMFATLMPIVDANSTATAEPLMVHAHRGNISPMHHMRLHVLPKFYNPLQSGHLSAESVESEESNELVAIVKSFADVVVPVLDPTGAPLAPVPAPSAAVPAPNVTAELNLADPAPADDSMSASDAPSSKEFAIRFKRDVDAVSTPVNHNDTIVHKRLCPGRIRLF